MESLESLNRNAPLRILIVDDDVVDREHYKRLLSKSGGAFEIFETDSVRDGLAFSREKHVDCILLDYRLPDADGIVFIQSLKEQNKGGEAAVIMVTGQGCEETAVEAMKLGALDYVSKDNISDTLFVQSILNAVERAHLRNQVALYQEELEKSNTALSEFTRTVAHDLKAPLRRIISYCDLLREEAAPKLEQQQTEYILRLAVNARRLQRLVDDLLAYARAMHAKEKKEERDLGLVVAEVIEDLGTVIGDSGAKVNVAAMPVLSVYPLRIKQLFQNLIANAIKYRSRAAPVIDVTCADKGCHWIFSVRDNGLGIAEEYREKIFKEFERLHNQDDIEGSGLGLSICSKVIAMHAGKIWVEGAPGGGSIFYFTLPKK